MGDACPQSRGGEHQPGKAEEGENEIDPGRQNDARRAAGHVIFDADLTVFEFRLVQFESGDLLEVIEVGAGGEGFLFDGPAVERGEAGAPEVAFFAQVFVEPGLVFAEEFDPPVGALVLAGDIGHAVMGGSGDIGVIDLREGPGRTDEATEFVELQFFFSDLVFRGANAVAEVDQEDPLVEQALHGGRVLAQVAPGGELCQSRANALGVDQEGAAGGGCFGDVAFEFFQAGDAALGKVVDDRDRPEFLFEMANAAPGGVGLGEELMAAELTGDA